MANRATRPARWDDVEVGDTVEIRSTRHVLHRGLVDARTPDGTVVWVIAPAGGRRMFHIADGYALAGLPAASAG
jgi:hypothetical protein